MKKRAKKQRRKKHNKYAEHSKAPKYRPVHRCSTKSRFGTFNSAENVRRQIETKYPDRKLKSYFCPACQKYHHAALKDSHEDDQGKPPEE